VPHVLVWLLVLAGTSGQPVQILVTSDPFPTLAACEAWDRVQLTMQATTRILGSESKCVPAADMPPPPKPQPSGRRTDV
jgi:hypothetical protein